MQHGVETNKTIIQYIVSTFYPQHVQAVNRIMLPFPKFQFQNSAPQMQNQTNLPYYDQHLEANYMNNVSKNLDFLYKNYVNYKHDVMHQGCPPDVLKTRLRPLFLKHKFELAKTLYLHDLQDEIESIDIQLSICERQLRILYDKMPPRVPYLFHAKYAPYFWILNDQDFNDMSLHLQQALVYGMTSFNMVQADFEMFIRQAHVRQRYDFLLDTFIRKETHKNNALPSLRKMEQMREFEQWALDLLKKRVEVGTKMIRDIREKKMRPLQRERQRKMQELNRVSRIALTSMNAQD